MTRRLGILILQAFREPWVQFFVLPLLAALLTTLLRSLSRPDRKRLFEFKREDFLVGIGLGVTGFLTLATTLFKASQKYESLLVRFSNARIAGDAAAAAQVQQQVTDLFGYLFGLTAFFVIFLGVLIFMALQMSHQGWEPAAAAGSGRDPKMNYLLGYDALGLVLLSGAIYIMGEL